MSILPYVMSERSFLVPHWQNPLHPQSTIPFPPFPETWDFPRRLGTVCTVQEQASFFFFPFPFYYLSLSFSVLFPCLCMSRVVCAVWGAERGGWGEER